MIENFGGGITPQEAGLLTEITEEIDTMLQERFPDPMSEYQLVLVMMIFALSAGPYLAPLPDQDFDRFVETLRNIRNETRKDKIWRVPLRVVK
jgi:hypothetical protein